MWSSSIRTVTRFFAPPAKRGRYCRTGASRLSRFASTSRIAALVVPMTLVMDAMSHRVESGVGTEDFGLQVKCP